MRGTDTIGNAPNYVKLAGTGSYNQGATITLSEAISNFSILFFQFGTPGNSTGYSTVPVYGWGMSGIATGQPNMSMDTHGGKVLMTIDSATQITYTSGAVALRAIFGIRK